MFRAIHFYKQLIGFGDYPYVNINGKNVQFSFVLKPFIYIRQVILNDIMNVIGRKEKIDLPDLKLQSIDCKIDTGARTSSIHCEEISVTKKHHRPVLHFILLDKSHPEFQNIVHTFHKFRIQKVKSSTGHSEKRYVISTKVKVFDEIIETEFNLANRKAMNYPILLGRKFLAKRFIVDVSKRNLSLKNTNEPSS